MLVREEDEQMKLMKVLCMAVALIAPSIAQADRTITVDFGTATLQVHDNGRIVMETAVVLPRGNYYPVPVSGTITRAEMGPTWIPTANMHRDKPGYYRRSYGPYQRGNAMGHCKISINFDITHRILPFVRIHGNAREQDLGMRLSRSCVRIPDNLCQSLISAVQGHSQVRVHFVQ